MALEPEQLTLRYAEQLTLCCAEVTLPSGRPKAAAKADLPGEANDSSEG